MRTVLPWTFSLRDGASVAVLKCSAEGCANENVKSARRELPPQQMAKYFRQAGWDVDLRSPGRVRCPTCQQRKKPMTTTTNGATAPAPGMRALTNDERGKVRDLLDLNFDAKLGRFISGYSDDRIAREVNVPRKAVEIMRETAYGELKISPEMAKAIDDVAELKRDGEKVADEVLAMHKKVTTFNERAAALLARIEGRVN